MGTFDLSTAKPVGGFDLSTAKPVDDTPAPYQPKDMVPQGVDPKTNTPIMAPSPKYSPAQLSAAKAGVDVDSGLPTSIKWDYRLGFTDDPMEKNAYIINKLRAEYGDKFNAATDVRGGFRSPSGGMEYKSPDGMWHTFNQTSGALLGESLPAIGGAVMGGLGGLLGVATDSPFMARTAGAALGGLGQGGGEYIRKAIGKSLGLSSEDPGDAGVREGALAHSHASHGV